MDDSSTGSGDHTAFRALYDASFADIWGFARRRCADSADADDLVAEVFAVAWRRRRDLPSGDQARLWLFGVARNVLANSRRSAQRRARLHDRLSAQPERYASDPAAVVDGHGDSVRHALVALSTGDRELLILRGWDGLRVDEIAELLGCTPNAVSLRLRKARRRLVDAMERQSGVAHSGSPARLNDEAVPNDSDGWRTSPPRAPEPEGECP